MKKPSVPTVIRTAVLVLALVNQGLTIAGKSPLPIQDEDISNVVSFVITGVSAMAAWWKNNSFSQAAIEADEFRKDCL